MIGPAALLAAAASSADPVRALHDRISGALQTCPPAKDGEVVVCGHHDQPPPFRYQYLPGEHDRFDPHGPVDSVSRERHRLMDATGEGVLQNACSPVGAAGWTGCQERQWRGDEQQRGFAPK